MGNDGFIARSSSAAHISEEVSGASRAAPTAIMVRTHRITGASRLLSDLKLGVIGTQILGWLLYIASSFATTSVSDLLSTELPLPMGQLFLNTLGKRGMLAIWSLIIVVQVRCLRTNHLTASQRNVLVRYWGRPGRGRIPCGICFCS